MDSRLSLLWPGFISFLGTEIPQALRLSQKKGGWIFGPNLYQFAIAPVTNLHKFGGLTHLLSYSSVGHKCDKASLSLNQEVGGAVFPSRGSKGVIIFFCLSQLHLWPPWSVFKAVNGGLSPCVTSLQPSFASLLHFQEPLL